MKAWVKMKLNRLNAKSITSKQLPPGEMPDGGGLFLRVLPSGSKTWLLRYKFDGKSTSISLGSYPQITLEQVRVTANTIWQNLAKGINPKLTKETSTDGITFRKVMDLWFENIHKHEVKEDTWKDNERRIENHASGLLGMPINMIEPSHVVAQLSALKAKNQVVTISKTIILIRAICDWAVTQDMIKINPAAVARKAFAKQKTSKIKPLPYIRADRLHEVLEKAINGTLTRQSKDLLMCYILTGVRAKELVAAKWSNLKGNILTIEGAYMKNGRNFDIYLSEQCRAILERQIKKPSSPYIFPHRAEPKNSASSETLTRWLRESAGFKDQLVLHGFRKMFSTWANEQLNADETNTLYSAEIIERCLDHSDDDKIRKTYNGAIYPKLRLAVMQGWANYVGLQWQKAVSNTGMPTAPKNQLESSRVVKIGL